MQIDEANRIIAEYMGNKYNKGMEVKSVKCELYTRICKYSKSIDALVPVWEKLRKDKLVFTPHVSCNPLGYYEVEVTPSVEEGDDDKWDNCWGNSLLLSEAACVATAKAIQELKNNESGE